MKKSKLIAGLSAAFVGIIALASCSGYVKSKGNVILTYDGKDYTAEELFNDDRSAASAEAKFNAVYKVAVRTYFKDASEDLKKRIAKDTENKVNGQKATAQSNADKNGTSYDTEWKKILDSNGVEDEQGLYDKFEYDFQKEEFDDQFYENKFDVIKNGGDYLDPTMKDDPEYKDTEKLSGYIPKKQPYHVQHILIKVGAAEKDYKTGEISKEEANKISAVVRGIAEGEDFGKLAKRIPSDDSGSAEKEGDVGIMDRDTSFVNEFKLGTYIYESFFGSSTNKDDSSGHFASKNAKKEIFGDGESIASYYAERVAGLHGKEEGIHDPSNEGAYFTKDGEKIDMDGLGQIPYEAALALGKDDYEVDGVTKHGLAELDDTEKQFKTLGIDVKAKFLPRNVLFNKYFNKHNIMVITPRTLAKHTVENFVDAGGSEVKNKYKKRISDDNYRGIENANFKKLPGFNFGNGTDQKKIKNDDELTITLKATQAGKEKQEETEDVTNEQVLRDKDGRVVFVFRSGTSGEGSYQGIHFVCIQRSPFIGKEYEMNVDGTERDEPITLNDYFTRYYPIRDGEGDDKHPKYKDGKDKLTYVSWLNSTDSKEKKSRADNVKNKIKSYNPNLNTYIYRYLVKTGNLHFKEGTDEAAKLAQAIKSDINTWIERKREGTDYDSTKTWNETWRTYAMSIKEQTQERVPINIDEANPNFIGGTITEACVTAFRDWKVGTDDDKIREAFSNGGIFYEK